MRHTRKIAAVAETLRDVPCEACGAFGSWERDRRWPKSMGGEYHEDNVHRLCRDCHREKTSLEVRLRMGDMSRQARWFDLAYPRTAPRSAFLYLEINLNMPNQTGLWA
jgi:5-methylcytosine-specific restriction endonuclease McrA